MKWSWMDNISLSIIVLLGSPVHLRHLIELLLRSYVLSLASLLGHLLPLSGIQYTCVRTYGRFVVSHRFPICAVIRGWKGRGSGGDGGGRVTWFPWHVLARLQRTVQTEANGQCTSPSDAYLPAPLVRNLPPPHVSYILPILILLLLCSTSHIPITLRSP